jgi:Holliday junction resolvase-like predicted endonuclease
MNRGLVICCEVKTRTGKSDPREGYSFTQQKRLADLSERYINEFRDRFPVDFDLRYDLIVVGKSESGGLEVKEHIEDAFRPE